MAEHVISHRKPRRKRGRRFGRFAALAVTVCALAAASWLAPYFYRAPARPAEEIAQAPAQPPKLPPAAETTKIVLSAAAEAPATEARRPRRARRGVPLDASADDIGEDFEVLSAAELDAISQDRN